MERPGRRSLQAKIGSGGPCGMACRAWGRLVYCCCLGDIEVTKNWICSCLLLGGYSEDVEVLMDRERRGWEDDSGGFCVGLRG